MLGVIEKWVEKFCRCALVILFALMVLSASIQVVFRTLLNHPLTWTEELCRYSMVWLALIGSGLAVKMHAHIAVDILKNVLPEKAIIVIDKINLVLMMVFSTVLIYFGFGLCAKNMGQLTPGLKLPMGIVYGAVPLGGMIILFHSAMELSRPLLDRKEKCKCQSL